MASLTLSPQPALARASRTASRALKFNLLLASLIWMAWLVLGGSNAAHHLLTEWRVVLTMAFGSLVGGGTSQGGGAIAFPVFTKLLHVNPYDARNFSLAIQSVGMGAASLTILFLRIPIERRALLYAGVPAVAGVIFGATCLAPFTPPVVVRTSFTVLVASIGIALVLLNHANREIRNLVLPLFGRREQAILIAAGFVGGIVSALVGTGENSVTFMVMVLLFRINEKIATPTTVILMSMAAIPGFLVHLLWLKDFSRAVAGYWLAAIPVVVVGAPLGAVICSYMSRRSIVNLLLALIGLEVVSTIALVPLSRSALLTSGGMLLVCGSLGWFMNRVKEYVPSIAEAIVHD